MDNVSMLNDEKVKNYIKDFLQSHTKLYTKLLDKDIIDYLLKRYDDSESIRESAYRLLNDIEERPKCRCGNRLHFRNINKGYNDHCSNSCAQSDPLILNKSKNTKIKRYGENYKKVIHEKIKASIKEHYGVEFALQLKEKQQKAKETCKKRYGDENYRNISKAKDTCLKNWGTSYYLLSDDCKRHVIEKFGVDNYRKTDECKQKVSKFIKEHKEEIQEKKIKTFIEKYGVDNPMKIDSVKEKFNWEEQKRKEYITKKKNKSFKKSQIEVESYDLLKEKFNDVIHHYKSEKYPFVCDFYIPSLDLYIECNYHWTHGGHPYKDDENDNKVIENWKSKNTKYYINAIECWTVRDVTKRNTAKQNNLNYIEFWSLNELKTWINKQ